MKNPLLGYLREEDDVMEDFGVKKELECVWIDEAKTIKPIELLKLDVSIDKHPIENIKKRCEDNIIMSFCGGRTSGKSHKVNKIMEAYHTKGQRYRI